MRDRLRRYGYANYEDMRNDPELTFFAKIDPTIKIGASFEALPLDQQEARCPVGTTVPA